MAPSSAAGPASATSGRKIPDPRHIITPDAFTVAPDLLGRPLATPWIRGAAMAVDGLLIALLSNAPSVLFAFAAGFVLFRISFRSSGGGYIRRSLRLGFRMTGAFVLFVAVLIAWGSIFDDDPGETEMALNDSEVTISGMEGLFTGAELIALHQADSEEEALVATRQLTSRLQGLGLDEEDIEEILEGTTSSANPDVRNAVETVLGELDTISPADTTAMPEDSLAVAYATAISASDTVTGPALRSELMRSLAADTIEELSGRIEGLEARQEQLEQELDEERDRGGGILSFLRATAEDFGLGIGWSALYFTAFLALWRGQTPGKRLFGIRVIRLNGGPITWWAAFERFGGYAAGLATGLLGYLQIFWDANRQAVHDKIAQTVVIKE